MTAPKDTPESELHVLSPPDTPEPQEPQPLCPQAQAAVLFFGGESIDRIARTLNISSLSVEAMLRLHFQGITQQTEALLSNCKALTQQYHEAYKLHVEPTLAPQTESERIYKEAQSELYFEAAQRLQSVIDTAWEARIE